MQFPLPFLNRIQDQFPLDAQEFIDALTNEAKTSLRFNRSKTNRIEEAIIPWTDSGFFLPQRPSFTLDPLFHAGQYYVQEASSMLIEQVFKQYIQTENALRVLDICAAPGGKSTHIMSLMNENSYLISNEFISNRSNILSENIIKWGTGNAIVTNSDPSRFAYLQNHFDLILLDAPCSGEGLFRKSPEACNEWSENNCSICVKRQKQIFAQVWNNLKDGGTLIYSTCTFNPEENEKNLDELQKEYDFESLPLKLNEDWNIHEVNYNQIRGYQFLPHKSNGEGFYLSVLRKKGFLEEREVKYKDKNSALKLYIREDKQFKFDSRKVLEKNYLMPHAMIEDFDAYKSLHIKHAGVCIGEEINKKLIPDHSLALFSYLNKNSFPIIEVEKKAALNYLAKRDFTIEGSLGWNIISFENFPLGFIKNMGNRFNNYYPNEWKIRMNF